MRHYKKTSENLNIVIKYGKNDMIYHKLYIYICVYSMFNIYMCMVYLSGNMIQTLSYLIPSF